MNIGIVILLLLSSVITYRVWTTYQVLYKPAPTQIVFGQQVGKTKYIQSKNGDASMFTQNARRAAIAGHNSKDTFRFPKKAIRETRTSSGQYTGYLEAFMLSTYCCNAPSKTIVTGNKILPDIIDGGNELTNVFDYVIDGGDAYSTYYDYEIDGEYAS